jgi:predicted N-formylglutamate amidohydrolase
MRGHEAFEIVNDGAGSPFLFVCDHAANALPPDYGTLGLSKAAFTRHIAFDIGAADLTRALAGALGAPAILARYSRLLIDLNRDPEDPTLIMALSDGEIIPGNHPLTRDERRVRHSRFYEPYHGAIAGALDGAARADGGAQGRGLVSIHSFTPAWKGQARPWHVGVLWNRDGRIARPLLDALHAESDLVVGDNEPYSGELEGDCMDRHGTKRGIAHVLIEIRQDLLATPGGVAVMAARLSRILGGLEKKEW